MLGADDVDGALPLQMLLTTAVYAIVPSTLCPLTIHFHLRVVRLQSRFYVQVVDFDLLRFHFLNLPSTLGESIARYDARLSL